MKYIIQFNEVPQLWVMKGVACIFICDHLISIAKENNLTTSASSESHHLQILRDHGIEIEILEEDGSKVIW
jgi:DNA-binding transcriptional ArsR family regulator